MVPSFYTSATTSVLISDAATARAQVLAVKPLEGTLEPQSSTFLHFTFRPLEALGLQLDLGMLPELSGL